MIRVTTLCLTLVIGSLWPAGSLLAQAHVDQPRGEPAHIEPRPTAQPPVVSEPAWKRRSQTLGTQERTLTPTPNDAQALTAPVTPDTLQQSQALSTEDKREVAAETAPAAVSMPLPMPKDVTEAYWALTRAEYQYWTGHWAQRAETFAWQHLSGAILFWIVVAMTLFGLVLAWIQFGRDTSSTHSLKVSKDGVELSSSFLGVVILALSGAFLYLYLLHVYPIHTIASNDAEAQDAKPEGK